jgi:tRNA-dihydrouridine synthase B
MFPLTLKSLTIDPPFFLAPMAGITHSAFRRLVADFGGYGALYTEMLSGTALLGERVGHTPFTKRRQCEGTVWYQVLLNGTEDIPAVVDALHKAAPAAIELNAGCPAPEIRHIKAGAALFADEHIFEDVLKRLRAAWAGPLTVKCRLWSTDSAWQPSFLRRLEIIETCGADAVVIHPRFSDEKLKRPARWKLFEWIAGHTKLPVIANGDICGVDDLARNREALAFVQGVMIGRGAAVRPWIFRDIATWPDPAATFPAIDYTGVWTRFFDYVNEDFVPPKAIGRIKEFAAYFARNFFFGHQFWKAVQSAPSLEEMHKRALTFLASNPTLDARPSVAGI